VGALDWVDPGAVPAPPVAALDWVEP